MAPHKNFATVESGRNLLQREIEALGFLASNGGRAYDLQIAEAYRHSIRTCPPWHLYDGLVQAGLVSVRKVPRSEPNKPLEDFRGSKIFYLSEKGQAIVNQ